METPDRIGREAILEVHVSKKELPLGEDVDMRDIASMTTGFTGYIYSHTCCFVVDFMQIRNFLTCYLVAVQGRFG